MQCYSIQFNYNSTDPDTSRLTRDDLKHGDGSGENELNLHCYNVELFRSIASSKMNDDGFEAANLIL